MYFFHRMGRYCCVPYCSNRIKGHEFPKDPTHRQLWVIAIKRMDPVSKKLWQPTSSSIVCKEHFLPEDYRQTLTGNYDS